MNKIYYTFFSISIIIAFLTFFTACETDFDIAADWKEITIVYGIINPTEANQFVRIQKAFLDEETSALQIAAVSDSLYHQQILSVNLIDMQTQQSFPMQLVNGENFGIYQEGIFAASPNLLYRSNINLDQEHVYQLKIENTRDGLVTSSTPLIESFNILTPNNNVGVPDINIVSENGYKISFRQSENAYLYDLIFRFFYTETLGGNVTNKQFDWKIVTNKFYTANGNFPFEEQLSKEEFFTAVSLNITDKNEFITREIDSLQFHIFAGAEALNTYNQTLIAQQTSISAGQSTTPYTNINNGLGLFSSRYNQAVYQLDIDNATKDSLVCNPLTKDLNFLKGSISQLNCN